MSTNKYWRDPDIAALETCIRGLDMSSNRKMLEANLRFLWDRYIAYPSKNLPKHLQVEQEPKHE